MFYCSINKQQQTNLPAAEKVNKFLFGKVITLLYFINILMSKLVGEN